MLRQAVRWLGAVSVHARPCGWHNIVLTSCGPLAGGVIMLDMNET